MVLGSHLQRQAAAHVAGQAHVEARLLEDMVGELGGSGLTVAAGDADHLGIGIPSGKLNLAHDGNTLLDCLSHHGSRVGDTGALDDFVGIENLLGGVATLFPCDIILIEQILIGLSDVAGIAQPHVHTLHAGEHSGSSAALAATQYY